MLDLAQPIPVQVTHEIAARQRPPLPEMHPDMALTIPAALLPALLESLQYSACFAKQMHWCAHPKSEEFMEHDTGRKGWRAYLAPDIAHLMNVVEEAGLATFEEATE